MNVLTIKVWGSRGSLPSPHVPEQLELRFRDLLNLFFDSGHKKKTDVAKFLQEVPRFRLGGYGGNTTCVEVKSGETRLIVDGGSGIRPLGYDLLKGPCGSGTGEVHILFTHFHWDHLIGLPFFTPIFVPGNRIHLYSVQPELEDVFRTLFRKPFFPVAFESLGSKITYHRLEARKPQAFGDIRVTPYRLDHPDPCWGYKFESGGRTYSHCFDTEATRVTRSELGEDAGLFENVDLMVFDAQYTLMETIEKINWGHAAASIGLDIAMREGIKRVLFIHHDPASTDEKVAAAEAEARRYYTSQLKAGSRRGEKLHEVEWFFVHEGYSTEV